MITAQQTGELRTLFDALPATEWMSYQYGEKNVGNERLASTIHRIDFFDAGIVDSVVVEGRVGAESRSAIRTLGVAQQLVLELISDRMTTCVSTYEKSKPAHRPNNALELWSAGANSMQFTKVLRAKHFLCSINRDHSVCLKSATSCCPSTKMNHDQLLGNHYDHRQR